MEQRRKTILALILVTVSVVIALSWFLLQNESNEESPGPLAPDFVLTDIDGNAFKLSDFRGEVVILDFMTTWCGTCRTEMSHLKVVWEKYGDKIVLISIDIDPRESEEIIRAFISEFPYATWVWARDTADLIEIYEVWGRLPKLVIIDRVGNIRFTHLGVTDASTLIQEIDPLLG